MRTLLAVVVILASVLDLGAQEPRQPKVAPGPNEPDWEVVLRERYGLSMFRDLSNPVKTTIAATPGLFRKAGPGTGEVHTRNRARPRDQEPWRLVSSRIRSTGGAEEGEPLVLHLQKQRGRPPHRQKLAAALGKRIVDRVRSSAATFGFWISNDGLPDGGVFTEPAKSLSSISGSPSSRTRP